MNIDVHGVYVYVHTMYVHIRFSLRITIIFNFNIARAKIFRVLNRLKVCASCINKYNHNIASLKFDLQKCDHILFVSVNKTVKLLL